MNVENVTVHSSGHSPVSQIATHILYILPSAVSPPALNSSAGTSSGPVALRQLLSDGSHEQHLNEVVEALSPNILVQFHSLPHRGTSLHNTISTCLRLRFGQLQSNFRQWLKLECRAVKTRSPLKFAGVPQTNETISAASMPKFTILWGYVEEILRLNKSFFSDCRYVQLQRHSPTKLWDGAQMAIFGEFLRPAFSSSGVQHVSDLHLKFALRPCTMCGSMADIQSATAEIRRGNKKDRKKI